MRAYSQIEGASVPGDPDALGDDEVDLAVEIFRLLADATRVRVLAALADTELPVKALADAVRKPQSTVSQHLAKLRMGRMVTTRREGNQVFYRLSNEHVRTLVVDALRHAEHAAGGVPKHHTEQP